MISQTTYGSDKLLLKINSKSRLLRDKRNGLSLNETVEHDYTFDLVAYVEDETMTSIGSKVGTAVDILQYGAFFMSIMLGGSMTSLYSMMNN